MKKLQDRFNRVIDYMRISITGRCNLRCLYCIPKNNKLTKEVPKDCMTAHDIVSVARCAAELGVKKIRITGGEPLIRQDIFSILDELKKLEGITDLSLTTNGMGLAQNAKKLKSAGLDRVNISLDSLNPQKFKEITRGGCLDRVFQGIEASSRVGLVPIKLNMVPIRGINDNEVEDFARLTFARPFQLRFIELMPFNRSGNWWSADKLVSVDEIKGRLEKLGTLLPQEQEHSGPARYYKFVGSEGSVGFISPMTHHFCNQCNRLRLTSEGKLRPCLFLDHEIDVLGAMQNGAKKEDIKDLLIRAVSMKPRGHEQLELPQREMSFIGG